MYDAVLSRLSVCAVALLSGCALIGYDLSANGEPHAGSSANGSGGRAGSDGDGERDGGTSGAPALDGGNSGQGGVSGWWGSGGFGGWPGWPPSAGIGGDADAAVDAGGDAGGSLLPDPCPGEPDGTPCFINAFCKLDMTCTGGVCMGGIERDCSELDGSCIHGACYEEGRTCLAKPDAEGTSCGLGQACHEGVCRTDEVCDPGQDCDLACAGGECHIACDGANTCTVACPSGTDCDIDCQGANTCAPSCESATCDVDCRDASNCNATCVNSDCRIRCEGAENCEEVVCTLGASCLIECGGSECEFALCSTNDVQQCPGDVLVCNGPCP